MALLNPAKSVAWFHPTSPRASFTPAVEPIVMPMIPHPFGRRDDLAYAAMARVHIYELQCTVQRVIIPGARIV